MRKAAPPSSCEEGGKEKNKGDRAKGQSQEMELPKVQVLTHKQATDATGKQYTSYELLLATADGTYKLSKRYSEFEALQRAIKKDIAGVHFPAKTYFAANPVQRCSELNTFMQAVCSRPLSAGSKQHLCSFVASSAGASSPIKAQASAKPGGPAEPGWKRMMRERQAKGMHAGGLRIAGGEMAGGGTAGEGLSPAKALFGPPPV